MVELFVGTYSDGDSRGLTRLAYVPHDDFWTLQPWTHAVENASYAAYSPRHGLHYVLDERAPGRLGVYRLQGPDWERLADLPTGGDMPCFVTLDPAGAALAVANYASGSVSLYRLDSASGLPQGPPETHGNIGGGPNAERQDGPHAHCVQFHNGRLYRTDLGADEVLAHELDPATGRLGPPFTALRLPAGQGPRHIAFHPTAPVAYVLTELGSRLFTLAVQADGRLRQVADVSTLPAGFSGDSLGGHLALSPQGDRLYASNRGHDSIAVFAIGEGTEPVLLQIAPSHGRSPRHFCLLQEPRHMVVAHEEGGSLSVLAMAGDGTIAGLRQSLPLKKPVFVGAAPLG
jgi:6-phosphogluconolactonase